MYCHHHFRHVLVPVIKKITCVVKANVYLANKIIIIRKANLTIKRKCVMRIKCHTLKTRLRTQQTQLPCKQ